MGNLETTIAGGIGLLLLMAVYHFVWCGALLSVYRQDLFFLRDQMFIDAANGKLDFRDPGYGMMRMLIQRSLRSSGRMGAIHLLAYWLLLRDVGKAGSLEEHFSNYLTGMKNREQADLLRSYQAQITKVTALHFTRLYWPFLGVVLIWIIVRTHARIAARLLDWILKTRTKSAQRYLNVLASDMPSPVRHANRAACPA